MRRNGTDEGRNVLKQYRMGEKIIEDALFAAIAAIGFAAISKPPRRAYLYCAIVAAAGHSCRYILMNMWGLEFNIITATLIASFLIGVLAVFLSPVAQMPAETCFFPALLPMVPGIYAYKTFGGLAKCLFASDQETFNHYFYLFTSNGLTCIAILFCMVIGATLPMFIFKKVSFSATRQL